MAEVRVGIDDQLPTHATAIPGRLAQHVVKPLVVTAADRLGHLLHVATPTLEQTAQIPPCRALYRAGEATEARQIGREVGIEVAERRGNNLSNAIQVSELTS